MLKFGYITELDTTKGMARVHFTEDDVVSNPLPVSVPASKEDKVGFPFSINEQVWCLMDDNCEFGVIGGAIYSAKDVPNGFSSTKITLNVNGGKCVIEIDRATGNLSITGSGKVRIENSDAGLKALIEDLKGFIESIKVNTPAGPSAGLITPTPAQLSDFQTELNKLLY